jgi:hypothetical protein
MRHYFLVGKPRRRRKTMPASNLIRWCGLAAILAGVLLSVAAILHIATETKNLSGSATTAPYALTWLLYLLGGVLLLLGLVGLYAHQSEASGILGLVSFLVAFLGTAFSVGSGWYQLFVAPSLAVEAPEALDAEPTGMLTLGFVLTFVVFLTLGWVLFGIAALRAGVYPRMAVILLMIGVVINFLPTHFTEFVFNVAVAWLGFVLFTGRGEAVQQPARVS